MNNLIDTNDIKTKHPLALCMLNHFTYEMDNYGDEYKYLHCTFRSFFNFIDSNNFFNYYIKRRLTNMTNLDLCLSGYNRKDNKEKLYPDVKNVIKKYIIELNYTEKMNVFLKGLKTLCFNRNYICDQESTLYYKTVIIPYKFKYNGFGHSLTICDICGNCRRDIRDEYNKIIYNCSDEIMCTCYNDINVPQLTLD